MFISNDYSTSNIFNVNGNNRTNKNKNSSADNTFDTISISDAAKEAYNNSKTIDSDLTTKDEITKAVEKAKYLASQDARDEHNTLEFYAISPTVFKYVPEPLKFDSDIIGQPASSLPTAEERELANKKLAKIYDIFNQAYENLNIDMSNLSVKEKFYLMKDQTVNNFIESEFLSIIGASNQYDLIKSI